MQLDNKAFYADLFTKSNTPGPGRQLVPAAPVVPMAAVNDETPPAPEQAAQSTKSAKAVRALPAAKEPAGVVGGGVHLMDMWGAPPLTPPRKSAATAASEIGRAAKTSRVGRGKS